MSAYLALLKDIRSDIGWRMSALVALMVLVGFTEGLSVALLFPLLSYLGIAGAGGSGTLAAVFNRIFGTADTASLSSILTILVLVAVAQAILALALNWWMIYLTRRYQSDWQMRLFNAIMRAKWSFFTESKSGDLANTIITETGRLSAAFTSLLQLMASVVIAVIYLGFALVASAPVTLCLIGVVALMVLSISRLYKTSFGIGYALNSLNSTLQVHINEYLAGAKVVKTSVGEGRASEKVESVVRKLERGNIILSFLPQLVRVLFEFFAFVALVTLFAVGPQFFQIGAADVIIVLALFLRLLPRVTTMQTYMHSLNHYAPAIVAVRSLVERADALKEYDEGEIGSLDVARPTQLELRKLTVAYDGREVLKDVDVTIPIPGLVGLMGGSGAGKSTLVHAILGLTQPDAGVISLGPHVLTRTPVSSWRRAVGYVPQETVLFNASVAENLCLARPEASFDEIREAAQLAHAHEFIQALPRGYETEIGDQGVLLSGGQRQRLGIARALLARPSLLLMDEPTSALDLDSEREILAAVDELRARVGILIISHKADILRNASMIYVLDNGRLARAGTWDRLFLDAPDLPSHSYA